MKLSIHDPGHVALRRGIRAAIATPVTAALALWLFPKSPAGIVAVFASLCLVAICDFGGPTRRRFLSLLGAAAAGAVLIAIGVLASQSPWVAVPVTLAVGFVLALVPVLRGSIASGAPAMMIMYVVAITAGIPAHEVGTTLLGWLLAVVVAIPITLFVLPRRGLAPVRQAVSGALVAFADAVGARAAGAEPDQAALTSAQDALRRSYLGNPFRAAGLSSHDRALVALAGHVEALLSTVISGRAYPTPLVDDSSTQRLSVGTEQALRAAGTALGQGGGPEPSGLTLVSDWRAQWDTAVDLLAHAPAGTVAARVHEVDALFPDRSMAVAAVRVVMLARRVLGLPDEQYPTGPDVPQIPAPPVRGTTTDLREQFTLKSPWMRLALRTGLGLALAVLVVSLTGLAHGLWVVLGVTSVLRFDGLTTMKTAGFAMLGTFLGAAVAYGLLAADSTDLRLLWVALIVATFLAVFVPAAVGFALGQAAFSLFVIAAFTLMTWPPDVATAAERFEDVAVGALVSIVVALLLWPGGVMAGLIGNVADGIRASNQLLRDAMSNLVTGSGIPAGEASETTGAVVRAQEVVEISLASPNKNAAAMAYRWQAVIDHLRMPTVAGRLLAGWSQTKVPIASALPQLEAPLMAELDAVLREWEGVAHQIDDGTPREHQQQPATLEAIATTAEGVDVTSPAVADSLVAAVWGHGWLRMSLHAGLSCEVPTPA